MEKTSRARSSELRRPHRARVGISSVEVVVATLIIAAALVPIYGIFVRSRTTITRSRIAYLALQAAREELEEIRQIPFGSLAGHEWEPVSGHVFRRTIPVRPPTSGTSPVAATDLIYPDEYTRIQTRKCP